MSYRWPTAPLFFISALAVGPMARGGAAAKPLRIVSTSLASDEILLELMTRAGEERRLVAVSTLADDATYSSVSKEARSIKERAGQDIEAVLKLNPDLVVLASYNRPETIKRYEQAKVRIHLLKNFNSLADVIQNIRTLATITHTKEHGEALLVEIDDALNPPQSQASGDEAKKLTVKKKPRVLSYARDGTVSAGGTLFDSIVTAAGGINVASEAGLTGWPRLGAEALLKLKPEILVAAADADQGVQLLAEMKREPGWRELNAVIQGKVVFIPARELASVSHHVVKAVLKLRAALLERPP